MAYIYYGLGTECNFSLLTRYLVQSYIYSWPIYSYGLYIQLWSIYSYGLGTECNFGLLTRCLVQSFIELGGELQLLSTVEALQQQDDKRWVLTY